MTSSAAMNRLFQKGGGRGGGGSTGKEKLNYTQFTCSGSLDTILSTLSTGLEAMRERTKGGVEFKIFAENSQVKATKISKMKGGGGGAGVGGEGDEANKILLLLQIYQMTPSLYLIECTKRKGDIFEYYAFYKEIKRLLVPEDNAINSNNNAEKEKEGEGPSEGSTDAHHNEEEDPLTFLDSPTASSLLNARATSSPLVSTAPSPMDKQRLSITLTAPSPPSTTSSTNSTPVATTPEAEAAHSIANQKDGPYSQLFGK